MEEGATTWLIPDAYLPAAGQGELQGHEAICILNTGDQPAAVALDFFFEDREPRLGVPVTIGPRRTLHVRTDRPEMLGGFVVPRQVPYALRVRSSVPVVVQYSRLDVTQPNLALMTCVGYPVR
ncbi:MAG: sensory rhodopsin transducer [Armatimonadota bacterium]|nr:sensory rhodopsin transducer [Armatimonadota bacterium]